MYIPFHVDLGPTLLGTFLNVLLYGIFTTQVIIYATTCKQDHAWVKLMVAWLFLLDTLSCVFGVGFVYRYAIDLFGNFEAIKHSHWFFHLGPLMTVTTASTAQCFFAWRIGRLTSLTWIAWSIVGMSFIQFLAGTSVTISAWILVDFERFGILLWPIIVWLATSVVTDVTITWVLTRHLQTHRTGFQRTDDVITRIIRQTVQTGLITTIWALVDLIMMIVLSNNLHFILNIPIAKLYTNSLMSTLNSRSRWGTQDRIEVSDAANGIAVHISTIREHYGVETTTSASSAMSQSTIIVPECVTNKTDRCIASSNCNEPQKVDLEAGYDLESGRHEKAGDTSQL